MKIDDVQDPTILSFIDNCNALMMGQVPTDVIMKAIQRLQVPERWTKEAGALTAEGKKVQAHHPEAAAWCLQSAVALACNPYGILPPFFMVVMDNVAEEYGCDSINVLESGFNHDLAMQYLWRVHAALQEM